MICMRSSAPSVTDNKYPKLLFLLQLFLCAGVEHPPVGRARHALLPRLKFEADLLVGVNIL